jgi:hypothetical protein
VDAFDHHLKRTRGKKQVASLTPEAGRHLTLQIARSLTAKDPDPKLSDAALGKHAHCLFDLASSIRHELYGEREKAVASYHQAQRSSHYDDAACVLGAKGYEALSTPAR